MFYQQTPEKALRFGDVVSGLAVVSSLVSQSTVSKALQILVENSSYCAVLSPCCSIGEKKLSLSPLIQINPAFLKNPFLKEDLTRINKKMGPDQAVPPEVWEKFDQDERTRRELEGSTYAFVDVFIYKENPLLSTYELSIKTGNIQTGYWMIDFRRAFSVQCDQVTSAKSSPLEWKLLQLSITSRKELREKVSFYFSRVPAEDQAALI